MQQRNAMSNGDRASEPGELAARMRELLESLMRGTTPDDTVVAALAIVERHPLASGGAFRGDLVRGLMEVPGAFWGRHPRLYQRYVHALRACAAARRTLPPSERMDFWCAFEVPAAATPAAAEPFTEQEITHGNTAAS